MSGFSDANPNPEGGYNRVLVFRYGDYRGNFFIMERKEYFLRESERETVPAPNGLAVFAFISPGKK